MMDERTFQEKLTELAQEFSALPEGEQARLKGLAEEAKDRHEKMKKTINELTESLDYLRLSVKYLVFDLEATRRENQYLRKLLDQKGIQGGSDSASDGD